MALFNTSINYENEQIHVNFLGNDFEKYECFKVHFVDIFNNLTFHIWEMQGPHMWCFTAKSFLNLNGIKILIYDKEGDVLLHVDEYDFNLESKKTIHIENQPLRFYSDEKDASQWWAFYEIVLKDFYNFTNNIVERDDVVVDIGANIGMFSLSALSKGAKSVFSIEAIPHVFNYLCLNTYPYKNIKCFNNAISRTNELMSFYIPKSGSTVATSFSDSSWINDEDIKIQCQGITFNKFITDQKIEFIDCLKIDCEGGEWDMIELNYDFINNRVKKIELEVHPWGYKNKIENINHFKQIFNIEILNKLNNFNMTFDDNTSDGMYPIGVHGINYANM